MQDDGGNSNQDTVLHTPAPMLPAAQVYELADSLYGLSGEFAVLDSERDQNYRITTDSGQQYVIKIANPSEKPAVLQMQAEALKHIAAVDPGLNVPGVVHSRRGLAVENFLDSDGTRYCVRVLTYVVGARPYDHPVDWALLRSAGAWLARLDLSLREFFHPAARGFLLWDLKHSSQLRSILDHVLDSHHRALAEFFVDRFDQRVLPAIPKLRAQVVHNDFVPDNMLVAVDEPTRIVGVIDLGDMSHAPLINDLACTTASMIREQVDVVAAAGQIVSGYQDAIPLETQELELLYDLIGTRLTAMCVIACWRVTLHPENQEYIFGGTSRTWATLEAWRALDPDDVAAAFLHECGL